MDKQINELRDDAKKATNYFTEKLAFTITPVELKELSEENSVKIVDVRKTLKYNEGHIPMAISVPYEEIENRLDEFNKEDLHVVYGCNPYCHKSTKSALMLAEKNIQVLELCGGYEVWKEYFRFATTEE